jgi:hypothetical protein
LTFCYELLELFQRKTSSCDVVLTDVPAALPLLEHNLVQNRHLLSSPTRISISTLPLDWMEEEKKGEEIEKIRYDWMVASDVLYNVDAIPAFVKAVKRRMHSTSTVFLLAHRWRKPDQERRFFRELDLEWKLIHGQCPVGWQEYGDPSSADSNRFFCQTMVSVRGSPKPLAEIDDEQDTASMSQAEFQAWERAQIQIYYGCSHERSRQSPPV